MVKTSYGVFATGEVDWWLEYHAYAVNRDSRLFENSSPSCNLVVEVFPSTDENEVANILGKRLWEGKEYDYALYNEQHEFIGFAYYES